MTRLRFPVQTLPMMFLSAVLATCAGNNGDDVAQADEAPVATDNVAQVRVIETQIATASISEKKAEKN